MKTLVNVLIIVTGLLLTIKNSALAEIELSFRFNDAGQKEMRAALDKFEQMNPGIKVELQRIAWGSAREQVLREAAVGEGPDVVHIAQVWHRSMTDMEVLWWLPADLRVTVLDGREAPISFALDLKARLPIGLTIERKAFEAGVLNLLLKVQRS
ncbi:MAG: extracellular solute-binding protein [SAR324 cluster bacterium]|nr:extracellular solute-binding protein [SAR324 cluster bacterium]